MEEENNQTENKRSSMGKMLAIVVAVLVLAGLGFWAMNDNDSETNKAQTTNSSNTAQTQPSSTNNTNSSPEGTSDLAGPPTKEQVALHNKKDDCWTIVSGKVYNITEYIPRHQGGDEIIAACGIDGTSLFTQRMTSDGQKVGSGSPHSSSAKNQLDDFFVGDLAQ